MPSLDDRTTTLPQGADLMYATLDEADLQEACLRTLDKDTTNRYEQWLYVDGMDGWMIVVIFWMKTREETIKSSQIYRFK